MIPRLPKGFSHPVQIGTGGFGSVYRARQVALGRLVALKFIDEKDSQTRAVLKREASLQADLHLPGIPQVYDVLDLSGKLCIVMQWINGCNLRTILQQNPPLDCKYAIATEIIAIASSLHERGYAHRDIKPENIIISKKGVFLIDFGLARHVLNDKRQTMADVVKGTPAYIAPELWQGRGHTADLIRADVFSLGKVIHEMLGLESTPECISKALIENPDLRLASARQFLDDWQLFVPQKAVDWIEIAEPCASKMLAAQLIGASQSLINERRTEEAYQLLVECLQTDPDSPDALEMMERFPTIKKKRSYQKTIQNFLIGSVAVMVGALSVYLLIGYTHEKVRDSIPESRTEDSRSLLIMTSGSHTQSVDITLPFKDVPIPIRSIHGHIMIASYPPTGHFLFDNAPTDISKDRLQVNAPSKEHILSWLSESKDIVWKEIILALPFEEKRICIKEW